MRFLNTHLPAMLYAILYVIVTGSLVLIPYMMADILTR